MIEYLLNEYYRLCLFEEMEAIIDAIEMAEKED